MKTSAPLASSAPLVTSNWLSVVLFPSNNWPARTWSLTPARMSHIAGVPPELPTSNAALLLMNAPRVTSVPPLNWNLPSVLVNNNRSASMRPAFRTLVPRRTSRRLVPAALVARNVPPSTTTRLLVEAEDSPMTSAVTVDATAALLITRRFPLPVPPTESWSRLFQSDPAPVITASLLALKAPTEASSLSRRAPFSITTRLPTPKLPMRRSSALLHTDPAPVTCTELLLLALAPMLPKPFSTTPPLLTTNRLPPTWLPMTTPMRLFQIEPAPVTRTRLLAPEGPLTLS